MDRLVTANPTNLNLHFLPSTRCSATITVTNLMHTMPVAVHVSTTRPNLFSLNPVTPFLLPPLSSATFTLTLSPLNRSPVTSPPDQINIKSAIFPSGKFDGGELTRLFSRPGVHVFKDSIPISLTGPHVIDTLLLNNETLESTFSISRVINSCSSEELSSLLRRSSAAGRPSFVSALVEAGTDVDSRGSDGRSPLSLAVSSGNLDAVRILVNAGARIDLGRDLVFHEAAGANRIDLISILEKSVSLVSGWAGSADLGGRTPIHYAAANGHLDAVRVCLESGGGDPDWVDLVGWNPLHCAAYGGFLDVVEFLIERSSFDPKIVLTFDGKKTPLDFAVEAGHSHLYDVLGLGDKLLRCVTLGDLDGVQECILRGVGMNGRDQNGWTALHRAAIGGWIEIVNVLIDNGAEVDVLDDVGFTPLRCAIESGHIEVVFLLVSHGGKARLKGIKGADLFSMKLDSCAVKACSLLFSGDNQLTET